MSDADGGRLLARIPREGLAAIPWAGGVSYTPDSAAAQLSKLNYEVDVTTAPYYCPTDGVANALPAMQFAANDVSARGGGVVWVPPVLYNMTAGQLSIPSNVALVGRADGPFDHSALPTDEVSAPTFLLGHASLSPLRFIGNGGKVANVAFYYPNQVAPTAATPTAYPATFLIDEGVAGNTVEKCTFINAYIGADIRSGRTTFVNNNMGCLYRDFVIDKALDFVTIDNNKSEPFWDIYAGNLAFPQTLDAWVLSNRIVFETARVDSLNVTGHKTFGAYAIHLTRDSDDTGLANRSGYGSFIGCECDYIAYGVIARSARNSAKGFSYVGCGWKPNLSGSGVSGKSVVKVETGGTEPPVISLVGGTVQGSDAHWTEGKINNLAAGAGAVATALGVKGLEAEDAKAVHYDDAIDYPDPSIGLAVKEHGVEIDALGVTVSAQGNAITVNAGAITQVSEDLTDLGDTVETLALTASVEYPTIADGLAATTEGGYFVVRESGDNYVTRYQKVGGVEVYDNALASKSVTDQIQATVAIVDRRIDDQAQIAWSVLAQVNPLIQPMASIAADGWQASVVAPSDLSMLSTSFIRQGFTSSGVSTLYVDHPLLTKRVRQPYPNQANFTANNVALSDYVYATDAIPGVTNNSAEISPKPTADWVMPSRLLVGNVIHWEIIAFHRDARLGRQVACVKVRATDGTTTTAWQTVSATAISTLCEDRASVAVFKGDLDVTALATGMVWLEAQAIPFIGAAASIRTTADYSGQAQFSPRYFLKDVARAAAPPLAYVSPTGNNATGVWSTDAATAKANPFATDDGARDALYTTGAGVTGGKADGCRIRIMAGTNVLTNSITTLKKRLDVAALVIERDPDSPRASCIASFGAAGWGPNTGVKADGTGVSLLAPLDETATLFYDVSLLRTGTLQIASTASGAVTAKHFVQYHNVVLDNGGYTGTWLAGNVFDATFGLEIANGAPSLLNGSTSRRRMFRGLKATGVGLEGNLVVGCEITSPTAIAPSTAGSNGIVAYANRLIGATTNTFSEGSSVSVLDRFVLAQNLVEFTGASSTPRGVSISADGGTVSLTHPIVIHNTATGIGSVGRWNILYDDTTGTARTHKLQRIAGNLVPQINHKGDEFKADAAKIGNFAFEHGVASEGNYSVYVDASGGVDSFRQFYPGIGSKIANGDPLFVNYQGTGGTTSVPVAGAGGGDYHLQSGSSAKNMVATPMLSFDLGGAARGLGVQAAGAYA